MYVPEAFVKTDPKAIGEIIRGFSFATVVSGGPEGFDASHLPLIHDAAAGGHGTLIGHMARANPQ